MAKTYSMIFGTTGDPRTYTGLSPTLLIFVNLTNGATVAPPSITESLTGSGIYQFTWGTTTPIGFLADAATTSPGSVGRFVSGQLDPMDRSDEYGTTLTAIGFSTLVYGSSLTAQGVTNIALGISQIAQGVTLTAIGTSLLAQGVTLTAAINFGATVIAGQVNMGVTLVAIGNTSFAFGTTNVAIGTSLNTLFSFIGSTASSFGTTLIDPVDLFGFLKRAQEVAEGNNTYTKATGVLDISSRGSSTLLREKTISDTSTQTTKT